MELDEVGWRDAGAKLLFELGGSDGSGGGCTQAERKGKREVALQITKRLRCGSGSGDNSKQMRRVKEP